LPFQTLASDDANYVELVRCPGERGSAAPSIASGRRADDIKSRSTSQPLTRVFLDAEGRN
jgi:hypothetical protein